MTIDVITTPDAEAAAWAGAEFVAHRATETIEQTGRFVWAVSGGSTPARFLGALAENDDIDWSAIHLFQVDERIAPAQAPERNDTMIRERLVARRPEVDYHPMPVEADDLSAALVAHLATMAQLAGSPVVLDLVQLGLGDDGHTASLIDGDPALRCGDDLTVTGSYRGTRRVTMTAPLLNRARRRLFLVTGAEKDQALDRLAQRDPHIPATLITTEATTLVTDRSAAE
jgi:6-phosphogluconolactonase